MEKIHRNMHVFVLSCTFLTCKHKNIHVSMYFFHLVLTFTPHYIVTDKGLLYSQVHVRTLFPVRGQSPPLAKVAAITAPLLQFASTEHNCKRMSSKYIYIASYVE